MPAFATRKSFSQKNLASDSRADSTFWLPAKNGRAMIRGFAVGDGDETLDPAGLGLRTEKNF